MHTHTFPIYLSISCNLEEMVEISTHPFHYSNLNLPNSCTHYFHLSHALLQCKTATTIKKEGKLNNHKYRHQHSTNEPKTTQLIYFMNLTNCYSLRFDHNFFGFFSFFTFIRRHREFLGRDAVFTLRYERNIIMKRSSMNAYEL